MVTRERRALQVGSAGNGALGRAPCALASASPRPELQRQLALASHKLDLAEMPVPVNQRDCSSELALHKWMVVRARDAGAVQLRAGDAQRWVQWACCRPCPWSARSPQTSSRTVVGCRVSAAGARALLADFSRRAPTLVVVA